MRVLHVIPSLSPVHGGTSTAMPLIERALRAEGVAVETATTDDDGPGRRLARPPEIVENGVLRRYFPRQTGFYCYSRPFVRWIGRAAREFDIVHTHGLFSHLGVTAARAARRAGTPYLMTPHGTLTRYGMRQRPALKKLSLALFEGPALAGARAVHCTSEQERAEALMLGLPLRCLVLPLGIDEPAPGDAARFLARHPGAAGRPRLVFLSRIHRAKNLEGAIDALALLGDGPRAPVLVVCGDGEPAYVAALRARAAARGVADRVVWTGFLAGAAKSDALAAGDVFVSPSFSENFGIAVVEALFLGLPAVLGRGIAIAGEIERAGAGVAAGPGPAEIAAAIGGLLARPDRAALGLRARRFAAETYSLAAMGRGLRAVYDAILAGRAVAA